jgi:trehalose 6-phosphate synthase/phosphatase
MENGRSGKVIIVSNRLPVTISVKRDEYTISKSIGGLATGLQTLLDSNNCIWVGWPGKFNSLSARQQDNVMQKMNEMNLVPVSLSDEEVDKYYEGYCNGILWPLFHSLTGELPLKISGFDDYVKVNENFAKKVCEIYEEGDLVWVHDLHLMLVPSFLRKLLPNAKIGFFLHIPFPSPEIFQILPQRCILLQSLLSSDLIGFHTLSFMSHFSLSVFKFLGVASEMEEIPYQQRRIRMGVFPMGVDTDKFEKIATEDETKRMCEKYKGLDGCKILLGIDRLDYTKGIPGRLKAYNTLLNKHPEYIEKVKLIQLAVPSRTGVEAYQSYRKKVESLVAKIQGKFSTPSWSPILYMFQSLPANQVTALYCAADVMLVTSMTDGMNLVAKEYVASRTDLRGVLVLSEFAGASYELSDALRVNPYDTEYEAGVLHKALSMKKADQIARMSRMRKQVKENNIYSWIALFLDSLESSKIRATELSLLNPITPISPEWLARKVWNSLVKTAQNLLTPKLVLFLDYDGTLVPIQSDPSKCSPSQRVLDLLSKLAANPYISVHIVSGRPKNALAEWFDGVPIGLHAEHGTFSKMTQNSEWVSNVRDMGDRRTPPWKENITKIFREHSKNIPGSFVEEKECAVAWHYRNASDGGFSASVANDIRLHLMLFAKTPCDIIDGNKVIEVCPAGMNKGVAVKKVIQQLKKNGLKMNRLTCVAIGDDLTDENMFLNIPKSGFSIHVGKKNSEAHHRFHEVDHVLEFLSILSHYSVDKYPPFTQKSESNGKFISL